MSDSPFTGTPVADPPVVSDPPVASDAPVAANGGVPTGAPVPPTSATAPSPSPVTDDSEAPSVGPGGGPPPVSDPTSAPVAKPTGSFNPMSDARSSYPPHRKSVVETVGKAEKSAADDLSPAEIFGITAAVLVFVCLAGFCFGRRWALWCVTRRSSSRQQQQPTGADEAAPFSPAEQDML